MSNVKVLLETTVVLRDIEREYKREELANAKDERDLLQQRLQHRHIEIDEDLRRIIEIAHSQAPCEVEMRLAYMGYSLLAGTLRDNARVARRGRRSLGPSKPRSLRPSRPKSCGECRRVSRVSR